MLFLKFWSLDKGLGFIHKNKEEYNSNDNKYTESPIPPVKDSPFSLDIRNMDVFPDNLIRLRRLFNMNIMKVFDLLDILVILSFTDKTVNKVFVPFIQFIILFDNLGFIFLCIKNDYGFVALYFVFLNKFF